MMERLPYVVCHGLVDRAVVAFYKMKSGSGPNPVALDKFISRSPAPAISHVTQSKNLHITRNGNSSIKKIYATNSPQKNSTGVPIFDSGNRVTTAQNDNRLNSLIALSAQLPEFSNPAARDEMNCFKVTEKSVQQPEIVTWQKTNLGREHAEQHLAHRLYDMADSSLIENVPSVTQYDMFNKPSYKRSTNELWETKVDPVVLEHMKNESQPTQQDTGRKREKIYIMEQAEKFMNHEVLAPVIKEIDKDKIKRLRNGREYLLLPSERRKELEQDVMEQRWKKEKRAALAKDTRLKTLMNNQYRSGILGGETLDDPQDVYQDKSDYVYQLHDRNQTMAEQRREFLSNVLQSDAGKGTLNFEALAETSPDEKKYNGGSKIFQSLTRNEISDKMAGSRQVQQAMDGSGGNNRNVKRLENIVENQTKGRNYNILTGALIDAPK
jgi:hypothetical protein